MEPPSSTICHSVAKEPRAKVTLRGAHFGDWRRGVSVVALSFRSFSHRGKYDATRFGWSQSCTSAQHGVAHSQAPAARAATSARTHSRCGATPRPRAAPRDVDHLARVTARHSALKCRLR